ncbi:MAG: amidohydrolase family protein [Bacteroides sp.]|nr:amidohydrolase family protein [Eubacterium sp.]MCM1418654.1 amidohydrolase family protein [Roseburia sp.]MCM1462708.1 amidohydrolase family protein [Bacteroides sp.]
MIVDFHTHTFPDKIAEKTIDYLAKKGNIKPYREGTLLSLKKSMERSGVDYSVVLPVATKSEQVGSINRLAVELNGKDGIIYAGAIHPDCDNIDEILDGIKRAGLFGIKLHPDYQGVYFTDERVLKILEGAAKRGLYTVTHAGVDAAYPDDVHCTPDHVLYVLDKLGAVIKNKLILAHMGGCDLGEEVLEKVCGKAVYLDTAVVLDRYPALCKRIIQKHGADKILFATDSPWADQKKYVELMYGFGFPPDALRSMLFGNAEKILSDAGIKLKKSL